MKWIEIKVIFESNNNEQAKELIANIFYDLGLKGVAIEEPTDKANDNSDLDWGEDAVKGYDHYAILGYFPCNDHISKISESMEYNLNRLKIENNIISNIVYKQIDDEDWAESWKKYFWPEKVSKNIVVKPTWRDYTPLSNEIVIEIDPGMAFGTGTHATTVMCIQMIEKYLKKKDSFLDIGTGSGILMITAAVLGANKVFGVDIDYIACETAEKNLQLNKIDTDKFKVICGNLVKDIKGQFNFVVANILSEVIITLLDNIIPILSKDAIFVCSGITENNMNLVINKINAIGLKVTEVVLVDKWGAIVTMNY